jgi:hypothetical protein
MIWVLIIAGAVFIIAAMIDAIWTIVWVDGRAGPITRFYAAGARNVLWWIIGAKHYALSAVGPAVLVCSMGLWTAMVWGGWVMILSADSFALKHLHTGAGATLLERIIIVGASMATIGPGQFEPANPVWGVCIAMAGLTGFFIFGLVATYIISLFEAVVQKRSFASQVAALGETPEDLIINAWDGRSFRGFNLSLLSLSEMANLLTERHQAYPLLHYFHASKREQSVPVGIAVFDEAITILTNVVVEDCQPSPAILHSARASVRMFLDTGENAYIEVADEAPPRPNIGRLREAGIPVRPDEAFDAALATLEYRRRQLYGFVRGDRRSWPSG